MGDSLTELAKRLEPLIVGQAVGAAQTVLTAGEGPGTDVVGNKIGLGGDSILVCHADGSPVSEYPATDAGLDAATAAMAAGDRLETPVCTFTAAHTLAVAGLYDFGLSSFTGQLTVSAAVIVRGLKMTRVSTGLMVGVYATAGESWLLDCDVDVESTDGTGWALRVATGATLHMVGRRLRGWGVVEGKPGYSEGTLYVEDCDLFASSAPDYFN